jgi:protein phosphatase
LGEETRAHVVDKHGMDVCRVWWHMLEISYCTDVGRARSLNEDSLLAVELGNGVYLLAVADGMGGYVAGEVASRMAVRAVEATAKKLIGLLDFGRVLVACVNKINHEIYEMSSNSPEHRGMGTTLVAAILKDGKAIIANVGDSRAYLIREGEIRRITKDHSYVQAMIDAGAISEEEAFKHPMKNVITRAVGCKKDVEADLYEVEIRKGDYLLLCSDGLTDLLSEEDIKETVLKSNNLEAACSMLVHKANEEGGEDNITVILAKERENGNIEKVERKIEGRKGNRKGD